MWLFCTNSKTSKKTRILAGAGLGQERNSASLPRDGLAGACSTTMIMMIRVMMLTMMIMMVMTWRCRGHCGSHRAKLAKVLCGAHDSKEKGLYSGYLRTQSACEKVFIHFASFSWSSSILDTKCLWNDHLDLVIIIQIDWDREARANICDLENID